MAVPAYLLLGIEHILIGFDHLLFVLALLLLLLGCALGWIWGTGIIQGNMGGMAAGNEPLLLRLPRLLLSFLSFFCFLSFLFFLSFFATLRVALPTVLVQVATMPRRSNHAAPV